MKPIKLFFRWPEFLRWKKLKLAFIVIGIFLLALIGLGGIYYHMIVKETLAHIQRGAINNVILSESPVYYDDGQTVAGVFFEKTHRKYIKYENIPPYFIQALVAAEDKDFFKHSGFSYKSIFRAMFANFRAGRVTQGGSTLTQQTAKNIFKREKRSYKAKIKELVQSLLLEKEYSKQEILEMYINQFFVTGFGSGLRIASQYFFNKEAENLDLVEAAFIAGSVKGPYTYNPFIKKTAEEKSAARSAAKRRKDYVLSNMLSLGYITEDEYRIAQEKEVPFQEGKVTYSLNVILDYIREQLESEYFKTILQEQGIENVATSGIRVYTSINQEIQESALLSLRTQLPVIDTKLTGYDRAFLQEKYRNIDNALFAETDTSFPLNAKIVSIDANADNPSIQVTWDNGKGSIPFEGIQPLGEAWLKWKLGNWAVFDKRNVTDFLKNFKIGDSVMIQSINAKDKNGPGHLKLSKIPEVDAGIITFQNGMIKAMAGGFMDRFFNRAIDAKRQLGSIFKPIIYTAALQLKWNTLDSLLNRREFFPFQNTYYIPNPDHEPKSETISMAWAGARSENIATVWLLYHLSDYLTMDEFQKIVESVGLNKKSDESYAQYTIRIRDKHGVVVDDAAITEAAFEETKKEIEPDLIFNGYEEIINTLRNLHYRIHSGVFDKRDENISREAKTSFQDLSSRNFEMKKKFAALQDILTRYRETPSAELMESLAKELRLFYLLNNGTEKSPIAFYTVTPALNSDSVQPLTPEWLLAHQDTFKEREIRISGLMPSESLDLIQENMKENHKKLQAFKRYDAEVLYRTRDFRVLIHLLYITRMSAKLGISSTLDPVLSFPLGANSISIAEAAMVYQTIMTGMVFPLGQKFSQHALIPIISKITDRQGEILWEYHPQPQRILSEKNSAAVSEILRMVMEIGTGQSAKNQVEFSLNIDDLNLDSSVPIFGKTGTANKSANSSFVGFVPGVNKETESLDLQKGYVIASYVGYDDNRPMQSQHISIYGASGALPLWMDVVNVILKKPEYKQSLQAADLAFGSGSSLYTKESGLQPVTVSNLSGFPRKSEKDRMDEGSQKIYGDVEFKDDAVVKKRSFEPLQGE